MQQKYATLSAAIYVLVASLLYVLFLNFDITSPRGFPLNPFENYYAINDYVFFSTGVKNVDGIQVRPSILFYLMIQVVSFLPQGSLSILFSLIGLLYVLRLNYIFNYCGIYPLVVWSFIPYLFYFSIFPSSDFLASLFISEIFFLLYKFFQKDNDENIAVKMMVFVVLASLSRANAIVFFIVPLVMYFMMYREESYKRKLNIIVMSLVTILLGLAFLYYYIGVFLVYISSSSEYLGSLELSKLDLSFLAKFFYSFGLRESFYTVAGEGFVKNHMYIYLRLALGMVLFISFLLVIFYRKSHAAYSNAVLVVYFLLFIPAVWGVAFERYFISIYPFILQYGVAIFKRRFF